MAENGTNDIERCSNVVVTYYRTVPAEGLHLYTNILMIIISVLSAFFGSIANILVILSYFKNSRLRTKSNIPLLSLGFSDLLVTAVVLPLHATRMVMESYGGHNCVLWTFVRLMSYFSAGVSLLVVTFISIERFITLAYPYRYQNILTRVRMKVILAVIWCITFALVVSHIALIPYKTFLALAAFLVIICIVMLLSIWTWIYKLLRNHKRRITTSQSPSQIGTEAKNQTPRQTYRNTRTTGAIVVGLILCYLPLVLMLCYYYTESTNFMTMYLLTPWGEMILLDHSFFHPLYVFWRMSEFRQTARLLICQLKCCVRDMRDIIGIENSFTNYRGE
ncbi:beta-2 adrenergic receptor-like [Dendronephthya gigantea]|uniref:beta-2 adrenergic receptor-like n=1 Tax=Dendronephthya gigantea TaxID=151771 RepID=UPI00106BD933|nr:beta-2 adrenergic receptor-like [Dendronephthya gigantea]